MSNNGEPVKDVPQDLLRVSLKNGKMDVRFGKYNTALLSHAIRLASLHLDNMIIAAQAPKKSSLEIPKGLTNRIIGS